jgi:hypothetical protein
MKKTPRKPGALASVKVQSFLKTQVKKQKIQAYKNKTFYFDPGFCVNEVMLMLKP